MSYTPTTWTTGDTITATAMNKIENGIANAGGYDAIFKGSTYISNYTITKVSGDFNAVFTKLQNFEPVKILYYEEFTSGYGVIFGMTNAVQISDADIAINVEGATTHTGAMLWSSSEVFWD